MGVRRRLVPEREVESMFQLLSRLGFRFDGPVDIRSDGVTFYPKGEAPGNDFDDWQAKDADRERSPHSPQA